MRKWKSILVDRDGESLTAYLHPPGSVGNSRFWAMSCNKAQVTKRSLKVKTFAEAKERALAWFRKEPERDARRREEGSVLTWEDWDAVQIRHFAKRTDQLRASKTLEECRQSNRLFVQVTGAPTASSVTADMVDRFQAECSKRLSRHGRSFSATTIRKTIAHLSASFNRCCNASGRKCVRGVVPTEKLLDGNVFEQVAWIEPSSKIIRHFTPDELKAFLAWKFLAACPLVAAFAKVSLWACGRIEEMSELRWDWIDAEGYVSIPDSIAKWGMGRMVRLPLPLLDELQELKGKGPYIWEGYTDQLKAFHHSTGHKASAHRVKGFDPRRFRGVFQKWVATWAREANVSGLSHHAFRRTGLQWSREAQLRNSEGEYAKASRLNLSVADKHYTTKPHRLWADTLFRNIVESLAGDHELSRLMEVGIPPPADRLAPGRASRP